MIRGTIGLAELLLQLVVMLVVMGMSWWSTEAFMWPDDISGRRMRRSSYLNGSITPQDPKYVIGRDNITLICSYNDTDSSSGLYFERKPKMVSNDSIIDSKYITVLSPTQIKLEMPAESPDDSGYYHCVLNNSDSSFPFRPVVAGMDVRVGYEPEPVKELRCVSENLESMTCSWCPGREQQVVWRLVWRVGSNTYNCSQTDLRACSCYLCGQIPERSHPFFNHCLKRKEDAQRPQFLRTTTYNFTVVAENMYGKAQSVFFIDPEKIVKPSPVENVRYAAIGPDIYVSWDTPVVSHFISLKYNLTYRCKWDHNSTAVITDQTSHLLQNLYPDTEYEITVTSKPVDDGFWSNATNKKIMSPETSPLANPTIVNYRRTACRRSFECFGLVIYWQPTPKKFLGGELLGYDISWTNSERRKVTRNVSGDSWSYHLRDVAFDSRESHRIELRTITSKGKSPPDQIIVPTVQEGDLLVDPVDGVRLENGQFINFTVSGAVSRVSSIGLFYCKTLRRSRYAQICQDDVNEIRFDARDAVRSHLIKDPGSDYMFTFAPYSAKNNESFGLRPSWLCVWDQCGDVGKPILALSRNGFIERGLVLDLRFPACGIHSGKVHLVRLLIEGPGYSESSRLVPSRQLVIQNLLPFTTYKVVVEGVGDPVCNFSSGQAEYNFTTPESVPSLPPMNVKVVLAGDYHENMIVTWDPSPKPNGIITSGNVLVKSENRNYTYKSERHSIKILQLPGYQNYSIMVHEGNSAGVSAWSAPAAIYLPMRAPTNISSDSLEADYNKTHKILNISWLPPKEANGPGPVYIVNVSSDKKTWSDEVQTPWKDFDHTVACSSSEITVLVQAKNCNKSHCFSSPAVKKYFSVCSPGIYKMPPGVLTAIIIFSVVVPVLVLLFCIFKVWRKYKQSKSTLGLRRGQKNPGPLSEISYEVKVKDYLKKMEDFPYMNGVTDSPYENAIDDQDPNAHLLTLSDSPYGVVAETSDVPNGYLHNTELKPVAASGMQLKNLTAESQRPDVDETPSLTLSVPLLSKTVDGVELAEDSICLKTPNGYDDCLIMADTGGDRQASESSDMTSPSSSGDSTGYSDLPETTKVPVTALPAGFQRSKSVHSISAISNASSEGLEIPCVSVMPNGISAKMASKWKQSDESDNDSLASVKMTPPTVHLPKEQFLTTRNTYVS